MKEDYLKVEKVIKSCQCKEHLDVANKLITYFYIKHGDDFLLKKLEEKIYFKKKLHENVVIFPLQRIKRYVHRTTKEPNKKNL